MRNSSKKFKIRKSVSNRFEITKNGIVLRETSFDRHLRKAKSKKQLRPLKGKKHVVGRFALKVKRMLQRA